MINLSPEAEPEIYATTRMFGTILENDIMNMDGPFPRPRRRVLTENTRASYPLSYIPNTSETGARDTPRTSSC